MDHDQKLRVYIIDDELPAINKLSMQLANIDSVELIGSSQSPSKGVGEIKQLKPDLIFLDINMPELDGFDIISFIPETCLFTFVSASQDYAADAFDTPAIDYLLKPVSIKRLLKCLDKAKLALTTRHASQQNASNNLIQHRKLISKQGERMFFVNIDDIYYINSSQGSVVAHTQNKAFPIAMSMEKLALSLPAKDFVRFHRSFIINVNYIKEVQRWFGAKLLVIMSDNDKTEITSSRDGARILKRQFHL